MSLSLYLDEDVNVGLAPVLRRDGHDVLTTREAGRAAKRFSDVSQLEFAISQSRILFTYDSDFALIATRWADEERHHFGILLSPERSLSDFRVGFARLARLYPEGLADLCIWLPKGIA